MQKLIKHLDIVSGGGSTLCAVHCMLMPALIGILPALGLTWLAGETFGYSMIFFTIAIGGAAIIQGIKEHKRCIPIGLFGVGVLLLCLGEIVLHGMEERNHVLNSIHIHSYVVAFGGFLIAISHLFNRILCKKTCKECQHES